VIGRTSGTRGVLSVASAGRRRLRLLGFLFVTVVAFGHIGVSVEVVGIRDERVSLFSLALGKPVCHGSDTMGDKSPKATNKQAAQKQAKANTNTQKKNNAAAAKQVVKTKK
jgi:hypothetical protein